MAKERKYAVLSRDRKTDSTKQVWFLKQPDGKWKRKRAKSKPDDSWKSRVPKEAAKEAAAAQEAKGRAALVTNEKYPWLQINGQKGNKKFGKKLQRIARKLERYLRCGWQRSKREQWELRQSFLRGTLGNVAAQCCDLTGLHDWPTCERSGYPKSNHTDKDGTGGKASDTSVYRSGKGGDYVNIENWSGAKKVYQAEGLATEVPGEPWHLSPKGFR